MARKALIEKWKRGSKYKVREYNRCRICRSVRAYLPNLVCAGFVSRKKPSGEIPGVTKASW